MKKGVVLLICILFSFTFISAACSPTISLINQDPYPAIPGEYVKLVFQVGNIADPDCSYLNFELSEKYPILFDPNTDAKIGVDAGFYNRDYSSFLIAPYKVRVDEDALEGDNPLETKISYSNSDLTFLKEFNLYVEDSKADFEVHIDDYSYTTQEMVVEILNIAESDIEALTIEIPKQNTIQILGTNRVVVGDLDSNEYTTADFTAIPQEGEFSMNIIYTYQTVARRTVTKVVDFDSSYFENTKPDTSTKVITYVIIIIVIVFVLWWYLRKRKSKRREYHHSRRGSARL